MKDLTVNYSPSNGTNNYMRTLIRASSSLELENVIFNITGVYSYTYANGAPVTYTNCTFN